MNRRNIIILALSCFLLGGAVGVFTMQHYTKKRIRNIVEMRKTPKIKVRLKEALELSESQTQHFDSVFDAHVEEMRSIRRAEREKVKAEMDELFDKLSEGLNDDQIIILRSMEQKLKRRHDHQHRGHRGTHGDRKGNRSRDRNH